MVETRFSLPANVFLQPNFGGAERANTSPEDIMSGKYATLRPFKKNDNHKGDFRFSQYFACYV